MGIETAVIVMAAVSATAEVGKMGMEVKAASERDKALDLQGKQLALQHQQKTLQNYDIMEKVLDSQQAYMSTTGLAFSSPSFNALQRDSYNTGAKKARNEAIEGELDQENIKTEKRNVRNSLYAQLFGDASNIAMTGAKLAAGMPSMGK